MRRILLPALCLMTMTSLIGTAALVGGAEDKLFQGVITDTQCALDVHSVSQSHKEIMEMKPELKTETECVEYCVKHRGGRYVLHVKDKILKLDKQELAAPFAGAKVRIKGVLDEKTGVIAVQSVEPVEATPGAVAHRK